MNLPRVTISLDPSQLSDLFFNYEHPEYDKYMRNLSNAHVKELDKFKDEMEQAIYKDAIEFCKAINYYPNNFKNRTLESLITEDFLQRI